MEGENKVVKIKHYKENNSYETFRGKRVKVRIYKNPGRRCTNWAWDIVQYGTGQSNPHYAR